MSVFWRTEPHRKNWHPVEVRPDLIDQKTNRLWEPKIALRCIAEVEEWLVANCKMGYAVEMGNADDDHMTALGRIVFRSLKDAAIFKVFWG